MPVSEDMFFPPRDCEAEQKMIAKSEFRLAAVASTGPWRCSAPIRIFIGQVDKNLKDLLALAV